MKFIVSSSTLLKNLQAMSGVLSTNNTLPILDNFLFDLNKDKLTISASDLETTISSTLSVEGKESVKVAIPAKILLDTLKTFPEQPLTFTVDTKKFGIEISSDHGKYKLAGQNGDEFPKIPGIEKPKSVKLKASVLGKAIEKTLFATGNDELRPVMSGVYCEMSKDSLTFVATDAHKLVRYTRTDSKPGEGTAFILPKKPLNILKSLLGGDDEVSLQFNESNAFFSFAEFNLICRLVDGKYPNYEAVIPKENPNKLTIERQAFLNSIKRVSIFSNKTTHQVRLKISGSEIQISAEDLDYANEANERLNCTYEGEDIEIGFNSKFLSEMLSNIETDEVSFEMSAPNRAGILFPVNGDDNKDEDMLMLVMPVMLN